MEEITKKYIIATVLVMAVALVSSNFEKITGQATATDCITTDFGYEKSTSRIITLDQKPVKGSDIDITVTPISASDIMNLGGADEERLYLTGPGVKRELTNYHCIDGGTIDCEKAIASTNIGSNFRSGTYCLKIKTPVSRKLLVTRSFTI